MDFLKKLFGGKKAAAPMQSATPTAPAATPNDTKVM